MRAIDGDALEELFREVISGIAKKPEMNGNLEHMVRASAMVIEMIQDAPTIEPEPHWIPCSERLPDKDDEYFVTVDPRHIPPGYRSTDKFIWHDGKWVIADYFVMDDDLYKKPEYRVIEVDIPVLAWMPLPEEYREGAE